MKFDNTIAKLKDVKDNDARRLAELKRVLREETDRKVKQNSEIKNIFKERERIRVNESQGDSHIMAIQFYFEDWFRNIGQFKKKPAKTQK